jgi:hypothetical protein
MSPGGKFLFVITDRHEDTLMYAVDLDAGLATYPGPTLSADTYPLHEVPDDMLYLIIDSYDSLSYTYSYYPISSIDSARSEYPELFI